MIFFIRRAPIELRVVVGQVSLIEPDPEEQTKNVYETFIFPSYNSEIKLHDIAMINVMQLALVENLPNQKYFVASHENYFQRYNRLRETNPLRTS